MLLDDRDRKLLSLLQKDCRLSNVELAEELGMSTSGCWRKVRAFEQAGIIERYGAVLNPAALGMSFSAIVHVQLLRHDQGAIDDFFNGVARRSEIQACYATTGQADYHLMVRCQDIDAYNSFLETFLFKLPAVRSAQTNVILKELKSSLAI